MAPTIYFLLADINVPSGGHKTIYRHVDLLNKIGLRAFVLHKKRGFRLTWFENNTPVTSVEELRLNPGDIAVLAEDAEPRIASLLPGVKKVVFNQNGYFTFRLYSVEPRDLLTPYTNRDYLGVIATSEDTRQYMEYVFPGVRLWRYHYSISPRLFHPNPEKKKQICFMPRKNLSDAIQVINILKFRGALRDYALVPIHDMTFEQAAAVMRESEIFLSFGYPEGFGLPPAEAMACGCLVVGYHGNGGREFLRPEFAYPIEVGDILGYARTVESVIQELESRPDPLRQKARRASEFILAAYSEEQEEADVARIWTEVLDLVRRRYYYHFGDSVVNDFSEFSGLPVAEIESRINRADGLAAREWDAIASGDFAEKALRFYAKSQSYIYELLGINFLKQAAIARLNAVSPHILAAIQKHGGPRFLEFGGGIGLVCEAVAGLGKEVTYLDIPGLVPDFAVWRFKKHGLPIRVLLSNPQELHLDERYDIIFSDAVLEHVIAPDQAVRELCAHVNPGGLLILLVDLSGPTPTNPMHRPVDIVSLHNIIAGQGFKDLFGRGFFCSIWSRPE